MKRLIHLPPGARRTERIVRPMIPPGVIGQWRSPNQFNDGNCEAVGVGDWAAIQATLTKGTTNPYQGTRYLNVLTTHLTYGYAYQVIVVGTTYRVTGAARSGDGTSYPLLYNAGAAATIWQGTSSTSWQEFDAEFTASNPNFRLTTIANGFGMGAQTEWDDLYVSLE